MSSSLRRAVDWLDERTGIRTLLRTQLTEYLIPATTNRWYSLGFVLLGNIVEEQQKSAHQLTNDEGVLVRHSGVSELPSASPELVKGTRRFFPGFVFEDLAVLFGLLSVFSAVLFFAPHLYLPPEAFQKADPFVTPPHVKPEWYFLASYEVLRLLPNKTLGILVQMFAFGALVGLPFLDRSERRPILCRPVFLAGVFLTVVGLVVLTVLGALA